ncbi:DUF5937 family protein [Streptomyces sp. S6]
MSVSIDIAGVRPEQVAFVPSPLAELGMALHALSEPGHHPGIREWTGSVLPGLDPHLADRLCEAEFLWRTVFSDLFLACAGVPGALPGETLAEELALLDKLPDDQFVDAALEFASTTCASPTPGILADPALRGRVLDLAASRGPRQLDFAHRLLDDPSGVRAWFRRFLEDCDEAFFADTWSRLRPQLAADTRHKTQVLHQLGTVEALVSVSPAVRLDEGNGRLVVDKLVESRTSARDSGLLLIPTSLGRPHLTVLHRPGWRPVVQYPLLAPSPVALPSLEQLTLRMNALSHPVRMQLCRNLARSAYTTTELARIHSLSAPEVSRHLAALKKAGLITTRRRGRYVLHQLDVALVARLGSDFLEGILR